MIAVLIVLLILLFAITILSLLKKQKSAIIFVIMVLCMIIGTAGMYFFNMSFRDNVNILLNPTQSHMYIVDNNGYYLPLPPKTASRYRTSDESAVYITKSELSEISALYRNISDDGTFAEKQENGKAVLSFEYNDYDFCISVAEQGGKRCHIIFVTKGDVCQGDMSRGRFC